MEGRITQLFNRFAGREVSMKEIRQSFPGHMKARAYTEVSIADPNQAVLKEMRRVAFDNGYTLRFIFQGSAQTDDLRSNRLNAHIEKGQDGKWRIGNNFEIG